MWSCDWSVRAERGSVYKTKVTSLRIRVKDCINPTTTTTINIMTIVNTHTKHIQYTHIYTYMRIYMYVYVYVCDCKLHTIRCVYHGNNIIMAIRTILTHDDVIRCSNWCHVM